MIGRTVGKYRIDDEIGRGGMSVVYRARDERLGRTVALKFLSPDLTRDPAAKERFLVEARAVSALDHPNVCTLHEIADTEDGETYIVLAYYPGETLAERIARGPLPVEEAVHLTLQVARALERAHASGVLHRDVKPANVVVTEHGEAKVLDFGLAKLAEGTGVTLTGLALGTPAYMSPEAARGEAVDARADLWSLGCVLHELLAGAPPFPTANQQAAIHAILHRDPEPVAKRRSDVPPSLVDLIGRLLAKDREERPPSATAVVAELEAIRRGEAVAPRARSRSRARAWTLAGAVVAALAAVYLLRPTEEGGEAGIPAPAPAVGAATTVAVLPFAVRASGEYDYLGEGLVDLLGTKLDGAGSLRSVDSHALLSFVEREAPKAAGDRAAAQRVARHFGAELFLQGDVFEAGGNLQISASLYARDEAQPLGRATVAGAVEHVFELVDDLVAGLLAERFSGVAQRILRTAATTTASLPALKTYLNGETLFRSGRFSEALAAFDEAVAIDPEFALAWYRLSVAAEWALRLDRTEAAAQQALALSDRLSEHDRRLLQARLVNRRGDAVEAERQYRAILALYPDDVEAWTQLGEVLFHYGPPRGFSAAASREAYERVLFYEPDFVQAMWHLARIAALEREHDEVAELVERIRSLNPEGERALEMEALLAFASGNAADQERVLAELAGARETVVVLAHWNTAAFLSDVEATRRIAAVNTRPGRVDDARATGHLVLAYLALAEGRWSLAREELDAAATIRPKWALAQRAHLAVVPFASDPPSPFADDEELARLRDELVAWDAAAEPPSVLPTTFFAANDGLHTAIRLYLLGLLEARLGLPEARERASALETIEPPPTGPFLTTDLAAEVRARIAWERGDRETALRELDGTRRQVLYQASISSPFASQASGRFAHARALAAAGRTREALRLFRSFSQVSSYDVAYEGPAALERGRILEAEGRVEEARAAYRFFVERWANADPELREVVDDARRRLDALPDGDATRDSG